VRWLWIAAGLVFTAVGVLGLLLPLLPGTPFFLLAAYAFARSSPRLHAWLLGLPHIGPAIVDYRSGLGIRRRVKVLAVLMAAGAVSLSATLAPSLAIKLGILSLGAIGVGFILLRVPTRESVVAQRQAADPVGTER